MTIQEFIEQANLTMSVEYAASNPHMEEDRKHPMDHWACRITDGANVMELVFSKGQGHHSEEPQLDEVLDCLASDAASIQDGASFEDWAADLGYDTDSRKAERTYQAVKDQAEKLRALLGDDNYERLLWEIERL